MKTADDLPVLTFDSQQAWEAWLDEHHADTPGVWLKMAKKETGIPSVTYAEALDVALCFGWIDGQKASSDTGYWRQRFTPRRAKSIWSQVNRDKVAVLIAADRMRPAGLLQIERAQADGRWDAAYQSQSTSTIPDDFASALAANPQAQEFFETLDRSNRYAILFRIHAAKRPATRAAKIETFIEMLVNHKKVHP